MRWSTVGLGLVGLPGFLAAQDPPNPPNDTAAYRALVTQAGAESRGGTTKQRVRIRSNDGRILFARDGGVAWLADSSTAPSDSTKFTIAFVQGSSAGVTIADSKGRCLSATARESSVPLEFGACNRDALAIYPAPNPGILAGREGFWLLTKVGQVGPTTVSPILMPRSSAKTWFRLEPAPR